MPLPFDFEGKGVFELLSDCVSSNSNQICQWKSTTNKEEETEPTSVLDSVRSPSPQTSTSTLSSSVGGGGRGGGGGGSGTGTGSGSGSRSALFTAGVAAVSGNSSQKWPPGQQETTGSSNAGVVESGCGGTVELQPVPPSLEIGTGGGAAEKCGLGMEDWEGVLPESVPASPSQEQSILRWIMGDVDDPSMGLHKVLQMGGPAEFEFAAAGGYGVSDQGFGLDPSGQIGTGAGNLIGGNNLSGFPHKFNPEKLTLPSNLPNFKLPNSQNPMFSPLSNNLSSISLSPGSFNPPPPAPPQSPPQQAQFESSDVKPPIFNPQMLINHHQTHQTQNPSFFLPLSFTHQQQDHHLLPPQPKRHNSGSLDPNSPIPKSPFLDSGQELFMGRQHPHHQPPPQGLQLLPHHQHHHLQQRPPSKPEFPGHCHQQQAVVDQLFKAAELVVQSGNPELAQPILARLNHQLSPVGKPFNRAAFYCKEALQSLLHHRQNTQAPPNFSPFNLIFKINAYKSFSEISPILQFSNFTCNQALLEAMEGFDRVHIIDFDVGFGSQWASFMQELALRCGGGGGGPPSLKITAFASPSTTEEHLELGLTRENLIHFASEINIIFEFEIVNVDSLNSGSFSWSENEGIAINLPVGALSDSQFTLPSILRFVKQLSPKIVVSIDRGCERTDLSFPSHLIHALQSFSNLLESLDAANVNHDALQKIERFLIQPGIEKIAIGRSRFPEKTQHWRTVFLSFGFSPVDLSNFAESQAECVVKRTPVRGFHVEKRQASLVLCWHRKELVSASAWRC